MTYRDFVVEITTWEGTHEFSCVAKDANGAKKQARAYMSDHVGWNRHCGSVSYRARREDSPQI